MSDGDFYTWLKHHRTNFPGLTKWLDGLKSVKEGLTHRWMSALAKCELNDAIKASDDLCKAADKPTRYEDHVGNIVGRCNEIARKRLAARSYAKYGEATYSCRWCQDGGIVSLFCHVDPRSGHRSFLSFRILADVQTPEVGERNLHVFGGFRCICSAGERWEGRRQFDPERHIVVEGSKRWRAATDNPGCNGRSWWDQVAERFERSSTAAFCGQIGPEGF